jgi:hypothetical protein
VLAITTPWSTLVMRNPDTLVAVLMSTPRAAPSIDPPRTSVRGASSTMAVSVDWLMVLSMIRRSLAPP